MFLNPEKAVEELKLNEGMIAADFGCGAGFYSIPAAKLVGSRGRIYAFDIRKEMLEMVRSKARQHHILNIETVRADLEGLHGTKLKDQSVDRVIIANILFQVERKNELIAESYRILKSRGLIMVIEWNIGLGAPAVQKNQQISKEEVIGLFSASGFALEKDFDAGDRHYGLIFRKP